jgi:phospholipid/cholesterol/gamma-HCH transport system substrate-binding protein
MLTLGTRLKNIAFLIIAALVLGYIGYRYADLSRLVGVRGYYVVSMDLSETGGLFPGSDVTYRGVSVGKVGALRVTDTGVRAELHINDSAPKIPANLRAQVANLSAVGEEYVDLRPSGTSGPYLHGGDLIAQPATQLPAPVTNLLTSVNNFSASVPLDSLRTVVDELGKAFQGQGENLQRLLDTGSSLTKAADEAAPRTNQLIVDGQTVLRTQREEGDAFTSFARSASLLADQLDRSDIDLRRLITNGPKAATQLTGLLRDTDPSLSVLLANLLTTSDLGLTRQRGLEEALVRVPQVVAAGSTAINAKGVHFGLALTFFSPLPCTRGYGGTTYRNGLDTTAGPALNTAATCREPASSGIDVRGSANAPKGGVPVPAGSTATFGATALPGALGLPSVPPGPGDMSDLLGLSH